MLMSVSYDNPLKKAFVSIHTLFGQIA